MINIKRPKAPKFLKEPTSKWVIETNQAIDHYKINTTISFEFKFFNEKVVKDALKKVFPNCAYCESNYNAVYDGDVEHFRPKGKVDEKTPQTPGYYWLANDWDNLFLACQHCNQQRKHILFGEEKLKSYGKRDQFPITNEAKRLVNHTKRLKTEESVRLLINPCKDDPTLHFAYEDTEAVIVPLTPMGEKSVDVFALKRFYLVQARKKQMTRLFTQMERVKRELIRLNDGNTPQQQAVFDFEFQELIKYTDSKAEYAGMSRFFVKKFLQENEII